LPGPKQVEILTLQTPFTDYAREFPGRVRASERVDLAFQVSGSLQELPATQGEAVKAGELLARLDPRDFQSDVDAARAELEKTQADFDRAASVLDEGFISQAEYDEIKSRRDIAASRLATAEKALKDTELRAPFAGVVATRYVENFTEAQAKEPIVSLQDVSNLELVVDVPERIVARIEREIRAELVARFDALPGQQFPVTVKEYTTEADPETQTYEFVLVMPRPEEATILPGMTVTVTARRPEAVPESAAASFLVPAAAVVADPAGRPFVWVLDRADRTVHKRVVQTGQLTGTASIEIIAGLRTGDAVVVTAAPRLREGLAVQPMEPS
jgi:RND family efflux transporter MFP subunit